MSKLCSFCLAQPIDNGRRRYLLNTNLRGLDLKLNEALLIVFGQHVLQQECQNNLDFIICDKCQSKLKHAYLGLKSLQEVTMNTKYCQFLIRQQELQQQHHQCNSLFSLLSSEATPPSISTSCATTLPRFPTSIDKTSNNNSLKPASTTNAAVITTGKNKPSTNNSYKQYSCFLCGTVLSKDLLISKLDFESTSNSLLKILQPVFVNEDTLGYWTPTDEAGIISINNNTSTNFIVNLKNKLKNVKYCHKCFEIGISAKDLLRQVESLQSEIIQLRKSIFGNVNQSYLKYVTAPAKEADLLTEIAEAQSARQQILTFSTAIQLSFPSTAKNADTEQQHQPNISDDDGIMEEVKIEVELDETYSQEFFAATEYQEDSIGQAPEEGSQKNQDNSTDADHDDITKEPAEIKVITKKRKRDRRKDKDRTTKKRAFYRHFGPGQFHCTDCGHVFLTTKALKGHQREVECTNCNPPLKFTSTCHLTTHRLQQHPRQKVSYVCKICNKTFNKKSNYISHGFFHSEPQFLCHLCPARYKMNVNLQRHIQFVHEGLVNSKHTCDVCGKQFTTKQVHKRHILLHAAGGIINKRRRKKDNGSSSSSSTIDHKKPRKSYRQLKRKYVTKYVQCEVCGKTISQKFIKRHKEGHLDLEYKCDQCPSKFKTKQSLDNHIKYVHEGKEYPYKCRFCNKGHVTHQQLLNHEAVHTKEKCYPCRICGKRFRVTGERKRHEIVIHTSEPTIFCHLCSKGFKIHRNLRRHLQNRHKIVQNKT